MEKLPKELNFSGEYGNYMKVCIEITVYWRGTIFDRAPGILDFHEQMVALIGEKVKYYATESMENAKRIKEDTFRLIPFWLSTKKRKRGIYILSLESGEEKNMPSDTAFYFAANEEAKEKGGLLRLMLPIDWFGKDYHKFPELASNLVKKLDFDFGQGGYSLNWDPNGDLAFEAQDQFPFIARRFLGIDIPDNDATLCGLTDAKIPGIKCVNWITLLGKSLVSQIGSLAAFKAKLGDTIVVQEIPKGLMVVAGPKPILGDKNRRESLAPYHEVGRLLEPLRLKEHPQLVGAHPTQPDTDISDEWLSRFDE